MARVTILGGLRATVTAFGKKSSKIWVGRSTAYGQLTGLRTGTGKSKGYCNALQNCCEMIRPTVSNKRASLELNPCVSVRLLCAKPKLSPHFRTRRQRKAC